MFGLLRNVNIEHFSGFSVGLCCKSEGLLYSCVKTRACLLYCLRLHASARHRFIYIALCNAPFRGIDLRDVAFTIVNGLGGALGQAQNVSRLTKGILNVAEAFEHLLNLGVGGLRHVSRKKIAAEPARIGLRWAPRTGGIVDGAIGKLTILALFAVCGQLVTIEERRRVRRFGRLPDRVTGTVAGGQLRLRRWRHGLVVA